MSEVRGRILCIEDDRDTAALICEELVDRGFEVELAYNGRDALAAIFKKPPDLVLSDWNMPNMTGIELLEALTKEGIKVKFGFVTTEATPDMRQRATGAGASFLISKPFTPESFKAALGGHIK